MLAQCTGASGLYICSCPASAGDSSSLSLAAACPASVAALTSGCPQAEIYSSSLPVQEIQPSGESGGTVTFGAYMRDVFLDQVCEPSSCCSVVPACASAILQHCE